jgi:thiol-disulfide isomerase/thioredoxin
MVAKTFTAKFFEFLNPKKLYIWLLLLVIALAIGAYRVLKNNSGSLEQRQKRKDVPNAPGNVGDVEILFFTVNWCPHCKKAQAPWTDFSNAYHGKKVKGRRVRCMKMDLTEKAEGTTGYPDYKKAKEYADKYKIEGYPTIKMLKDDQVIEFDAKVSTNALEQFVEDVL